jgi:hypothetical protein
MGIARRKSGVEVQCPRCHEAVVVPPPDLRQASHARRTIEVNQPRFERRDFDEIFVAALAKAPAQNPKSERNPKASLAEAPAQPLPRPAPSAALPVAPKGAAMAETTVDTAGLPPATVAAKANVPSPVANEPLLAASRGVTRLAAAGIAAFSFFAGILLGLALR